MYKVFPRRGLRIGLAVIGCCALAGGLLFVAKSASSSIQETSFVEKMVVIGGEATLRVDLGGRTGVRSKGGIAAYTVSPDSFFTIVARDGELRGPLPSAMKLIRQDGIKGVGITTDNLLLESMPFGSHYSMVVRNERTGGVVFNVEGEQFELDASRNQFGISTGRLRLSPEFAAELGRPGDAGTVAGELAVSTTVRTIEVVHVTNGQVAADTLPGLDAELGGVPGPDVIVGDLSGLTEFGSTGTRVGLAVGTDSCNAGQEPLRWFASPDNDHPVIPQNLYRMSGGAANDERFEQVGQSWVKHAFFALQENLCGFGCTNPNAGGTLLGSGCSDPYSASLNGAPSLGSRAWINPFNGFFPRNDSATPSNDHSAHTHPQGGALHRILVEVSDLNTNLNPGASYFAEAQYITPHEYAWCQTHPGQCNMYNNVSYRKYNVIGTGSPFSFSPAAGTVRSKAAIEAWPGATLVQIEPAPGADGIALLGYKVTNPSPGVWHYEYAIFNQNLDRAISAFGLQVAPTVSISNQGFHAPPQHPGWQADGTAGSAGFSSTPWTFSAAAEGSAVSVLWQAESFAQNPNANAIRWGTLYNFRFDSNRPPGPVTATVGFFKTGASVGVQVQGPVAVVPVSVSGFVRTSSGRSIAKARVTIVGPGGVTRSLLTNAFGYYRFDSVDSGATYTIGASAKGYTFPAPISQPINGNLTDLNFTANP